MIRSISYDKIFFVDINTVPWAEKAINSLAEIGIVNGMTSDLFKPLEHVTRAQFTKMICEAFKLGEKTPDKVTFDDVSKSDWFYKYVEVAASKGIIKGVSETEFAPNALITREQMAAIIYRTIKVNNITLNEGDAIIFKDANMISEYAIGAVNVLSSSGVINGMEDNIFAPKDNATRAQAAAIIYKCMIATSQQNI